MIGKFGGSHPNMPDIIVCEMERVLVFQLDRLKLGIPKYHQGLAAVLVIRNVVTDFDDYVIVGDSYKCIRKLVQSMMDVVYPKEEEVPTMMELAINAPSSPDKQSSAAAEGLVVAPTQAQTQAPQVDINLMSDAERVVYVNKLTTELSSKIAEISNLETELKLASSLALQKTEENIRIRSEYDLPMPFIDHKSPQKHWH